jgi:DNA polymerase-3 subunit alpha
MQMKQLHEAEEEGESEKQIFEFKDGQMVKFAGIISCIKKKYTKNNKLMAFVTIEDLYGQAEIIIFENCYQNSSDILMNDKIVVVEGRLSIREDEDTKIVANKITEFGEKENKKFVIDITSLQEETKERLRGAIKFFSGEKNNIAIMVKENEELKPCGGIYLTEEVKTQFEEIVGKSRVYIQ